MNIRTTNDQLQKGRKAKVLFDKDSLKKGEIVTIAEVTKCESFENNSYGCCIQCNGYKRKIKGKTQYYDCHGNTKKGYALKPITDSLKLLLE